MSGAPIRGGRGRRCAGPATTTQLQRRCCHAPTTTTTTTATAEVPTGVPDLRICAEAAERLETSASLPVRLRAATFAGRDSPRHPDAGLRRSAAGCAPVVGSVISGGTTQAPSPSTRSFPPTVPPFRTTDALGTERPSPTLHAIYPATNLGSGRATQQRLEPSPSDGYIRK